VHTSEMLFHQRVLDTIQQMARRGDGLLRMSDVCFCLGARRESVESAVRALERDGRVICVPSRGPIAVVAPVQSRADALRPGAHAQAAAATDQTADNAGAPLML
jgi:hypothetical protein